MFLPCSFVKALPLTLDEIGKLNDNVMLWYLMAKSSIRSGAFQVLNAKKKYMFRVRPLPLLAAYLTKVWPGARGNPYTKTKIHRIRPTIFGDLGQVHVKAKEK